MSTTYVDAQAAHPFPAYSRTQSLTSRSNSRSIRRSLSNRRSPNDARISAPPPDLIHDLLASFGTISVPSEQQDLHPSLRVNSKRTSLGSAHQRPSFSWQQPESRPDYTSAKKPSLQSAEIWDFNEAAEPPLIRRWRYSNAYSPESDPVSPGSPLTPEFTLDDENEYMSSTRKERRQQAEDQRSTLSSGSDLDSYAATIRNVGDDYGVHDPRADFSHQSLTADIKGKGKAVHAPPLRPERFNAYDTIRRERMYIPPSLSPSSPASTVRSSFNFDPRPSLSGSANYHNRFNSVDSTAKDRRKHSRPSEDLGPPQILESGVVVPPRGSSLKRVDSLTLLRRRPSILSNLSVVEDEPLPPEHPQIVETPQTEDDAMSLDVTNVDSDVIRRIKELRAAKAARIIRSSMDQPPFDFTNGRTTPTQYRPGIEEIGTAIDADVVPPLPLSPPATTLARKQLEEARLQNQTRASFDVENPIASIASSIYTATPRMSVDILPVQYVNFSRDRPIVVRSPSPSKMMHPVSMLQPQPQPAQLQPTLSRSKRWSQPYLSFRTPSLSSQTGLGQISPRKSISRRSSFMQPVQPVQEPPISSEELISESVSKYLQAPRLSQKCTATLESRAITFSEVGDPYGHPIICCVGMGMTRYIMAFYDELAMSLKLRLITPDRPGIGGSQPYYDGSRPPIDWPDDVGAICRFLNLKDFSILAHSAGAIYALATASRMPSQIIGKMHLLAPWIPPSQMSAPAVHGYASDTPGAMTGGGLPRSQRFLRMLPTPFLKMSGSSWVANGGLARSKSPRSSKPGSPGGLFRNSSDTSTTGPSPRISFSQLRAAISRKGSNIDELPAATIDDVVLSSIPDNDAVPDFSSSNFDATTDDFVPEMPSTPIMPSVARQSDEVTQEYQRRYDAILTPAIWDLATRNANPAIDLLICLERQQDIGFRYADVDLNGGSTLSDMNYLAPSTTASPRLSTSGYTTPRARNGISQFQSANGSVVVLNGIDSDQNRDSTTRDRPATNGYGTPGSAPASPNARIVIHHGSKDARVPLENAKWLVRTMKGVELRVIDGEGHGLLSSAGVMGQVLTEMAKDLEDRHGIAV